MTPRHLMSAPDTQAARHGERSPAWLFDPQFEEIKVCPECAMGALEGAAVCSGCGHEPEDDMTWRRVRAAYDAALRAPSVSEPELTFGDLRRGNVARLPQFKNKHGEPAHSEPYGSDWSPAQWLQAVVGELGEYANLRKKYERGDIDEAGFLREAADELADVQCYLDILAFRLGIDLGTATAAKWDRVSERVGSPLRLAARTEASGTEDEGSALPAGEPEKRETALWKALAHGLNQLPHIDPYDDEEWLVGVAYEALVSEIPGVDPEPADGAWPSGPTLGDVQHRQDQARRLK